MEALISGLILASVTALALIAYRHPKQYKYIVIPIFIVMFIVYIFITAWNGSSEMLSIKIERLLESNNNLESKTILKNHQYFSGYPITVIFLSIYAFLMLLLWLPEIGITHEKTKNSPKDPDNKKTK